MLICLLLLMMPPVQPTAPAASMVEWVGSETWAEALEKLNATGNVVIDGRAARNQQTTTPTLKLKPGRQTFWQAMDALCSQTGMRWHLSDGRLELVAGGGQRNEWVSYDGPWRAKLIRRTLIAYDDPSLDRLLCQVEISLEPRYQPLLLTLSAADSGLPAASYSFDGDQSKAIEVRLPRPPRSAKALDALPLHGKAWLAPGRLAFTLPLQAQARETQQETTCTITEWSRQSAGKTWEVAADVQYPPHSREWESHQSRLFGSMKMTLTDGVQQIADAGKDIRTDAGTRIASRWLFRNVPAVNANWKAKLTVPAAPVEAPVRFEFLKVELP